MSTDPQVLAVLLRIADRLDAIFGAVVEKHACAPKPLSDRDLATLAAIADATNGHAMTVKDFFVHAQALNGGPAVAMRAALTSMKPAELGRMLGRAAASAASGFLVDTQSRGGAGRKWRVRRVEEAARGSTKLLGARDVRFNRCR